MHFTRKLGRTIRTLSCLFMARTFGEYHHTVWDGGFTYARYQWRGKVWAVPTGPLEDT
jgi:hypothetical protein